MFIDSPMFKRLNRRAYTFAQMMWHLDNSEPGWIVETGCCRSPDGYEGDGASTFIWDWVVNQTRKFNAISLDISKEHVDVASSKTTKVRYRCGDSVTLLSSLPLATTTDIRLLYLDSFDWREEWAFESPFHHLAELAAVWSHLPSGCMIAIDDRTSETVGKHIFVEKFMTKLGIKPVFKEYQIGWIKP